jgi:hypothetical protein
MRKTITIAIAALAIGLTGCATDKDNANITGNYKPEVKDNFVNSCTDASVKGGSADRTQARATCQCIIDKLEVTLPYDQKSGDASFKDADMAVKDGKPLPTSVKAKFDQATAGCKK